MARKIEIERHPSALKPRNGFVRLRLAQMAVGMNIVGDPAGFRKAGAARSSTPEENQELEALLTADDADLVVASYHPSARSLRDRYRDGVVDKTCVILVGDVERYNEALVMSGRDVHRLRKISLSSEDQENNTERGDSIHIFEGGEHGTVTWAALNCHEYTHADIIQVMLDAKVELVVIVSMNPAARLYSEYAVADIHRLFAYVVVANIAEIGGSGVFAPIRRIGGTKHAQLGTAGKLFSSTGPAAIRTTIDLDIEALRRARKELGTQGFKSKMFGKEQEQESPYTFVVPSEHVIHSHERPPGPPPLDALRPVSDVENTWRKNKCRVAVAQLASLPYDAYFETTYRIRNHDRCANLERLLSMRLFELEERCRSLGPTVDGTLLDMLVLPEVYVPRPFQRYLQHFSERTGAIIIAGLDYPDGGEPENANECVVIRPGLEGVTYRKVTRSQYDARTANMDEIGIRGLMNLQRGTRLVRFVDSESKRGFGVLICCDYSHFDLVRKINLLDRQAPLDLLVVVAHNPFGSLYRACCVADSHRFYQYVVMSNVAQYGGSGVFAPHRTSGPRQVLTELGPGVEGIALVDLDLAGLTDARSRRDDELLTGLYQRLPGTIHERLQVDRD